MIQLVTCKYFMKSEIAIIIIMIIISVPFTIPQTFVSLSEQIFICEMAPFTNCKVLN